MNLENYWKIFSKTGKVEDYLKYVENKNSSLGVKDGEVFSGSAGDKGKEHWRE